MTTSNMDYDAILAAGESKTVEFKISVPRPDTLAREIAAFANTAGGHLLIGVRESRAEGAEPVDGIKIPHVEAAVHRALELLDPKPKIEFLAPVVRGVRIVDVVVSPSDDQPVFTSGTPYVRVDHRVVPARARDIVSQLLVPRTLEDARAGVERLAGAIEKQTRTIEEQRKIIEESHAIARGLAAANAWWRKMIWVAIGAVAGAVAREYVPVILDVL